MPWGPGACIDVDDCCMQHSPPPNMMHASGQHEPHVTMATAAERVRARARC
jgi:hypothetical protein